MHLEVLRHLGHLLIDVVNELLYAHDSLLATTLRTYGNSTILLLLLTDDDHVGNALQLVVCSNFLATSLA